MLLHILTSAKSPGIASGLTYESAENIAEGSIVSVPLRNKPVEGIVLGRGKESDFDLKSIQSCLHKNPLLSRAHIRTMQWMAEYYCCSVRQAMKVFLPSPPWSALLPRKVIGYSLLVTRSVKGAKQKMIIEYLQNKEWVSWDELRSKLKLSRSTTKPLLEKGIIVEEERSEQISTLSSQLLALNKPSLTPHQKTAYEIIKESKKPSLLFGITGSGKTEVYAQLIADCIEAGKQSILLVPEILLTEAVIDRFSRLIDQRHIAILHSRLTSSQRRSEWKRIRFGDVKLVIGSRSALFAPVMNLGIVIMDEEHEWTYKNEQTPRYHARETAQKLCEEFDAKLVLGTATPSLESWHRAQSGTYTVARLDERYGNASLPLVKVVDLAKVHFGNNYPFSNTLLEAIDDRLTKGEQSVLFLNRRGAATAMMCLECRRRIVSPDSNLPFTVHKQGSKVFLQDHTTGATAEVPPVCPACKSTRLHAIGAGTQKIEEILSRRFPQAKILRADSDTLTHPEQMKTLLTAMNNGEADILLGTQSVVKGLDLPNVTLAAVLIADIGMSLPHFRAGERTFQLLTQLTGRSGRKKPGEVIIQTFRPDCTEVKMAALHQTEQYLETELMLRKSNNYPPCAKMIRLIFRGAEAKNRGEVNFALLLEKSENLAIGYSPTLFGGGKEWHILIRGKRAQSALQYITMQDCVIDIDPMNCL